MVHEVAVVIARLAKICFVATFGLVAFIAPEIGQSSNWVLTDGASAHPEYRGPVPKKSDVVFSTRTKRDNSIDTIKAFGANRVEWVYSTEREFIQAIKENAGWFGGTVNSNIHLPNDDGVARDFDGNILVAPWMRGWGAKWVTTTHPDTVRVLKSEAAKIIMAGGDSIHVDDALLQAHAADWGGDFNRATLEGFSKFLAAYPDKNHLVDLGLSDLGGGDYRGFIKSRYGIGNNKDYIERYRSIPTTALWTEYLRESVRQHFVKFRQYLNALYGKTFPLSMNLTLLSSPDERSREFFLAQLADYVMVETPVRDTGVMAIRAATTRALGIGYVPSLRPLGLARNRVAIATLYALGSQPLVPWDVYIGNDKNGQPRRFFGKVEEYGGLYAFVRRHPELFEKQETAAVVGIPIPVDNYRERETTELIRRLIQHQIPFAFILAGGKERRFMIDAKRAASLKILVAVNPETDFHPEDLRVLRALPLDRTDAMRLTDGELRQLAPLAIRGDGESVKLYPRATPSDGGRSLVVHVIDESKGRRIDGGSSCNREIAMMRNVSPGTRVTRAEWFSPEAVSQVTVSETAGEFVFTVPECRLWGVLSLTFARGAASAGDESTPLRLTDTESSASGHGREGTFAFVHRVPRRPAQHFWR